MEQTKLERLLMSEVSGVDDPANQLPGWMVAKSVEATTTKAAPTKLAKIKTALGLGDPPGQEGLDMDRDELTAILDEREDALVNKVADALVAKSAPTEGEGATEPTAVETPEPEAAPVVAEALSAEDVAKAIEAGVNAGTEALRADMTAVFEALIERFEKTEKHIGIAARTSLDGQEADAEGATEPVEKTAPDLGDAIATALRR